MQKKNLLKNVEFKTGTCPRCLCDCEFVNGKCPYCGYRGTPDNWDTTYPTADSTIMKIKCPTCSYVVEVIDNHAPTGIQCPNCYNIHHLFDWDVVTP